jgi:hypothetical protein
MSYLISFGFIKLYIWLIYETTVCKSRNWHILVIVVASPWLALHVAKCGSCPW